MKRIRTTGAVALALLASLTACTTAAGDRHATPRPCRGGTYTWSDVRQTPTLTGLAKRVTLDREASSYTAEIDPLKGARRTVSFTTLAEGLDAKAAITSLGRHIRSAAPLAPLGEELGDKGFAIEIASDNKDANPARNDRSGAHFAWSYADVVEANFSYRCGDAEPARGHVATWHSTGTALLPCGRRSEDADAALLAAARERCPEGSDAAQNP